MTVTPPRTVLVADDSRFFRSMLSYALDEEGLRTLAAATGDEVLEILDQELPNVDLVLLDLVMPGMNGFEVLERIRSRAGGESLPVMVITQFGLNQLEKDILRKHGVTSVLTKSASMDRILFDVRESLHAEAEERRRAARVPVSLAVTVKTPTSTHISTSFNLSPSGMFLVHAEDRAPAVGTEVELKFWVPDEDRVFQVRARVAWLNGAGPNFRKSHPPGFGVEYLDVAEETREAIRGFLARS